MGFSSQQKMNLFQAEKVVKQTFKVNHTETVEQCQ